MNRTGEDKHDRTAEPFPPPGSLGLVEVRRARLGGPFELRNGESLPEMELVYETYGELNPARSNAVLICHALSGDHHAAGYHSPQDRKPGWWNNLIGPGKPIDTGRFHVVSCNNLGGCGGSTGPSSIDPRTGRHYGPDFPQVTVQDWVRSQALLAEHLGIERWAAVVGGSLGGMQALQWGIDFPDRIGHAICIAATPSLTAQNIAFNEVARQAILTDPDYHGGRYYDQPTKPDRGLRIARMLAHITYLSDAILSSRFGRTLRHVEELEDDIIFEIERYLNYQGDAFVKRFDANTYLLITRVLDLYDPAGDIGGTLTDAMKGVKADLLVVSFSSDWRFSPKRSREIVRAAHDNNLNVTYAEIESSHGHDTFLLDRIPQYTDVFRSYMERIAREL